MIELKDHEEQFEVKPVGIRYICEFCGKGEMKAVPEPQRTRPFILHACTKCGKEMQLPKMYPYIEWIPVEEEQSNDE